MKRENHLLLAIIGLLILLLLGTFWWGNRKIEQLESQQQAVAYQAEGPVSYTHLTLPTIYSV